MKLDVVRRENTKNVIGPTNFIVVDENNNVRNGPKTETSGDQQEEKDKKTLLLDRLILQ